MRCLTLADALLARGALCTFIFRAHNGHLLNLIKLRGHQAIALPCVSPISGLLQDEPVHAAWLGTDWITDAQETREVIGTSQVHWLVVDHYALDWRWEQSLKTRCLNLMVIDDLADRAHDCDLLLDPNLGRTPQDYLHLLKPDTTKLIGPQYALLRPEFAQWHSQSMARRTQLTIEHLLITLGGVDKDNATCQVLQALKTCNLPIDLRITVVMGSNAPSLEEVNTQASQMQWPTNVLVGVADMAQLMAESDLCIGAAGGTSWERCYLGLPTMLLVLADNQLPGAKALEKTGAVVALKRAQDIPQVFENYFAHETAVQLKRMSEAAAVLSDGLGVQRIVDSMRSEEHHA